MGKHVKIFDVRRITRIAIFASILFVQEEILTFLPNIQLTQCLIAVYYFGFGLIDTLAIVTIHVLLDNLVMGSFNLVYTPAMLVGWISLVLILHIFRKIKNKYVIATIVGLHGLIYSWCFLFTTCLIHNINPLAYLASDIVFEIILIINGFITTLFLFDPLSRTFKIGYCYSKNVS